MSLDYLRIYPQWYQMMSQLADADQFAMIGKLMLGAMQFAFDGMDPDFAPMSPEWLAWFAIRNDIERSEAALSARRENGAKGGRPKKSESVENSEDPVGAGSEETPVSDAKPQLISVSDQKPKKTIVSENKPQLISVSDQKPKKTIVSENKPQLISVSKNLNTKDKDKDKDKYKDKDKDKEEEEELTRARARVRETPPPPPPPDPSIDGDVPEDIDDQVSDLMRLISISSARGWAVELKRDIQRLGYTAVRQLLEKCEAKNSRDRISLEYYRTLRADIGASPGGSYVQHPAEERRRAYSPGVMQFEEAVP